MEKSLDPLKLCFILMRIIKASKDFILSRMFSLNQIFSLVIHYERELSSIEEYLSNVLNFNIFINASREVHA